MALSRKGEYMRAKCAMTTALRGHALHDPYAEITEITQRPLSRSSTRKREGKEKIAKKKGCGVCVGGGGGMATAPRGYACVQPASIPA